MKLTNPKPLDNKTFNERAKEILRELYEYGFNSNGDFPSEHQPISEYVDEGMASLTALVDEVNAAVIGEDTITHDSNGSLGFTHMDLNKNNLRKKQRQTAKDIIHGK